jgi:hypothetical protein
MTPFEKADRAKQLLADPVLKEALANIREALVAGLETAPMGDVDTHHHIALTLQALKRVNTELHRFVQDNILQEHKNKSQSFIERMREKIA